MHGIVFCWKVDAWDSFLLEGRCMGYCISFVKKNGTGFDLAKIDCTSRL